MNLFGCKFCKNEETFFDKSMITTSTTQINSIDSTKRCERKNFDSLLWALVTVFQVS